MSINRAQKWIAAIGVLVLMALVLFPPWREGAKNEIDYRKELGRAFLFRPPQPVAVDCYFVGCKTAPASYFHVMLYHELLWWQALTVLGVALAALWMFRSRRAGATASLSTPRTRLVFSALLTLAVPFLGTFPFAAVLVDLPEQFIHPGEMGWIPAAMTAFGFLLCTFVIFLVVSGVLWMRGAQLAETNQQ